MLLFPRKDGFSQPFCQQVASNLKGCFIRCVRCGGLWFTRQRARRAKFQKTVAMAGQFVLGTIAIFFVYVGQLPHFIAVFESNPNPGIPQFARNKHNVFAKTLETLAAGAFQGEPAGLADRVLNFRTRFQGVAEQAPDGKPFTTESEFSRRQ